MTEANNSLTTSQKMEEYSPLTKKFVKEKIASSNEKYQQVKNDVNKLIQLVVYLMKKDNEMKQQNENMKKKMKQLEQQNITLNR